MPMNVQPDKIGGTIRTVVAVVAGLLLSKLHLDPDTLAAVVGAVGTLGVAFWSVMSKRKVRNTIVPAV